MKRIGKLFFVTFLFTSLFFSTACGIPQITSNQYAVGPNSSSMKMSKGYSGSIMFEQSIAPWHTC